MHSTTGLAKGVVFRSAWSLLLLALSLSACAAPPSSFAQAKQLAREQVYFDRSSHGDLYCSCSWQWMGKSGGRVELGSCGYAIRAQPNRAARIEWEHVVPASTLGRQRQCWQQGGRDNCNRTDPVFNAMEADLHNLTPVVGEVNADRSNFNMGMVSGVPDQYGQCPFKVDFKNRTAEPPDHAKGMVARIHFYMYDRYGLNMSQQQERILMAWDRAFPVSEWEAQRERRIARIMKHGNEFVSGSKQWVAGYKTAQSVMLPSITAGQPVPVMHGGAPVIGNKKSGIYHLRGRCPGYEATSPGNAVVFQSAAQAQAAGYRQARNCK